MERIQKIQEFESFSYTMIELHQRRIASKVKSELMISGDVKIVPAYSTLPLQEQEQILFLYTS